MDGRFGARSEMVQKSHSVEVTGDCSLSLEMSHLCSLRLCGSQLEREMLLAAVVLAQSECCNSMVPVSASSGGASQALSSIRKG